MDVLLSVSVGIGLAAACGFRIFVPLFLISIAHHTGHLELASNFQWMGSPVAMVSFGAATLFEILAYYVPFFDNLLDTLAAPSAVVAGTMATASQVADMDPWLAWSVAIIGGGGSAGVVQGLTTITRQISSLATAGFGNPLVSTVEAGASLAMTALAVVAPGIAVILLLLLVYFGAKKLMGMRRTVENETDGTIEPEPPAS
ncbi:MAG: DUF4126 domain-containing protein, partial [Acidobacteriota bacterium]